MSLTTVCMDSIRQFSSPCPSGVLVTGHGVLDDQGREAVLTVETSDGPFGMLSIAPSSLSLTTEERDATLNVFINREFGASGQSGTSTSSSAENFWLQVGRG